MKGPFTRYRMEAPSFERRTWYTTDDGQAKRTPLPYDCWRGTRTIQVGTNEVNSYGTTVATYVEQYGRDGLIRQQVEYDSYRRLVGKLGPTVQMGMNLSQLGPTVQLFKGLGGAMVSPVKTVGNLMKNASKKAGGRKLLLGEVPNAYLAFQFGVKPVMQDIYSAVQLWEKEQLILVPLKAHASRGYDYVRKRGDYEWSFDEHYEVSCKRACTVSVRNHNLASLQQWGVLNPATVAWDLVPFSFVANWFLPIGTWLSSFSDFAGIDVIHPYRTTMCKGSGTESMTQYVGITNLNYSSSVKWERKLGLNTPAFPTHVNLKLGAGQIVTAGMLLLQQAKLWKKMTPTD